MTYKRDLTTGQLAFLLNVAPRTVSKWFAAGAFPRGWRLPGCKDRRIPVEDAVAFCIRIGREVPDGLKNYGITVLLAGLSDAQNAVASRGLDPIETTVAADPVSAGYAFGSRRPTMVVVGTTGLTNADVCHLLQLASHDGDCIRVMVHPEDRGDAAHPFAQINMNGSDLLTLSTDLRKALEANPPKKIKCYKAAREEVVNDQSA